LAKQKRKTKPPQKPKRRRRSAYDRALHDATERLEKALNEQVSHQTALESLAVEIPRLQRIIGALEPEPMTADVVVGTMHNIRRRVAKERPVSDQAEFLARFVKPVEGNMMRATPPIVIDENSDEPFLPPVPGDELLP